jgi:hypothetical protein
MKSYVPRGQVITAVQYTGDAGGSVDDIRAVADLGGGTVRHVYREPVLVLEARDRPLRLIHLTDWLT